MPLPDGETPPAAAPPPSRRGAGCAIVSLIFLLVAAAAVWYLVVGRPRLRFSNHLAAPVRLTVADAPPRPVASGETVTVAAPRGRTLVAEWELVRPLSADGRPMGEEVQGAVVLRGARGTVTGSAGPRTGAADYFAPLITNAGTLPLRITVNAGLQGPLDCGCAVRPGATRVFIGYYRLYRNSTVRARDVPGTREATFRDLGPQVKAADGTVGLRFEDRDLRPR